MDDPRVDQNRDPRFIDTFFPGKREYLPASGEQILFVSIGDVWSARIRCSRNGTPLKMSIHKIKEFSGDEDLAELAPNP